jgi:peptidoglycan/xylan/chitin deacetylase (PgdA/CDA1 family)
MNLSRADSFSNSVLERTVPTDVLALGYHMVSDEDLPHLKLYAYKSRRQFENDVALVQGQTVEYADIVNHRLHGAALPRNRVLFTFDDGFTECFENVRPILRKYGVGGVFFVSTDFIDDRLLFHETKLSLCFTEIERCGADRIGALRERLAREPLRAAGHEDRAALLLSQARRAGPLEEERRDLLLCLLSLWHDHEPELDRFCELLGVDAVDYVRRRQVFMSSRQLKTLAAEGFTIGAHALSHHSLQTMSRDRIEREIVSSCEVVREVTGQKCVPFAFPYTGAEIDRALLSDIRSRHRFIELIFDSGPLRRDEPFVVDRVLWLDDPAGDSPMSNVPVRLREELWKHQFAEESRAAREAFSERGRRGTERSRR